MKNRFVLGIVVVLSLQICFQAFNALERADDRYFQVRATTTVPSPMDAAPVMIAAIPDAEQQIDSTAPAATRAAVRQRSAAVMRPQFASLRTERRPQPVFETIRITYPARPAVPLTATPKAVNTVARTERPEKKRSAISRNVVPVIKKPYEFIKLLGSKLL